MAWPTLAECGMLPDSPIHRDLHGMPAKHEIIPMDSLNSSDTNGTPQQRFQRSKELCGASPPDRLPSQWAVLGNSLNYLRIGPKVAVNPPMI